MTTIRIDGQDLGAPQQVPAAPQQVYSVPLNATSAINIQLFEQRQSSSYESHVPITPSASTYVCMRKDCTASYIPNKYSVVINTDDRAVNDTSVYPINIANYSTPKVYATLPQQQVQQSPPLQLQLQQEQQQQQQQLLQQQQPQQQQQQQQQQEQQQQQLLQQQQQQQQQQQLNQQHQQQLQLNQQQQQQLQLQQQPQEQTHNQLNVTQPQAQQLHQHEVLVHQPPEVCLNADPSNIPVSDANDEADDLTSHVPHYAVTTINCSSSTDTIQVNSDLGTRNVRLSVGSELDSARGSIPDDSVSVNSSGSHGTSASLNECMTSLNLNSSNDDVIITHSGQQDFIYGRGQSLSDSIDSQFSNYGSMASPTSTAPAKEAKQVKFDKMLPLTWDEEEDEGSEHSLDTKIMDASAFILDDFTEEETKTVEDAEGLMGTRVALYKGQVLTAMLKVKCSTEEMGFDLRLLSLLQDMLIRCDQLGHKMKGSAVRLTPFHLNKMRLSDGRPSKERAAEVARVLGGDLILCEAVCQKHAERLHIATEIKEPVYEKGSFVVGKVGILVTLWKKHKYSVAAEFSSPLSDHIHFYRPHLLGNTSDTTLKRKRKGTDTVRKVFQSRELLSQMFKADPTITVAEAARRSFVEVLFYALYE